MEEAMTGASGDPTDLGERLWDVVVVGAGLAGAMVALELGRRGCEVLLLERQPFPRWKVCGACLNGAAQEALAHADRRTREASTDADPVPDAVPGLGPLGLALAALGVLAGSARALRNRERC